MNDSSPSTSLREAAVRWGEGVRLTRVGADVPATMEYIFRSVRSGSVRENNQEVLGGVLYSTSSSGGAEEAFKWVGRTGS